MKLHPLEALRPQDETSFLYYRPGYRVQKGYTMPILPATIYKCAYRRGLTIKARPVTIKGKVLMKVWRLS